MAAWTSTTNWREVIESQNYLGGEKDQDFVAQPCEYTVDYFCTAPEIRMVSIFSQG